MIKIRLKLFVGLCLLGMVIVVIGCAPPQPTQAEKQVLGWLRVNGCEVKKEKQEYQISWWEEPCVGLIEGTVLLTWHPGNDTYNDLKNIKQAKIEYDQKQVESQQAKQVLEWLKANGCEVKELGECLYEISWEFNFQTSKELPNPEPAKLVESRVRIENGNYSSVYKYSAKGFHIWSPIINTYDNLNGIKQDFQAGKLVVGQNYGRF